VALTALDVVFAGAMPAASAPFGFGASASELLLVGFCHSFLFVKTGCHHLSAGTKLIG